MASKDYPGWSDYVKAELIAAGLPPSEEPRASYFMDRLGFDDLDECIDFIKYYWYPHP